MDLRTRTKGDLKNGTWKRKTTQIKYKNVVFVLVSSIRLRTLKIV